MLKILYLNKRYIFFEYIKNHHVTGSAGSKMHAFLSVAGDKSFYDFGQIFFFDTKHPNMNIGMLQDEGYAIKGKNRFDMYLGAGKHAKKEAGALKLTSDYYILQRKSKY